MEKKNQAKKIATKKVTPKTKVVLSKDEYVKIEAIVGSIIFTPKEIEQSKKDGIDLLLLLATIQEKTLIKKKVQKINNELKKSLKLSKSAKK
jgi:hypothetical protein